MKCNIKDLSKSYDGKLALDHVDLQVEDGKILCILGPSGCGKSTMLKLIAGLLQQDSGKIEIDHQVVSDVSKKIYVQPELRELGFVFQNYALWPFMNVFDNIAYPLKVRKVGQDTIKQKVMEMLQLVKLEDKQERYPYELSGGEQQRVALARALVYEPSLVLLDEPLSNLDANLRGLMQEELKRIQKEMHITMIHVTHDQEEAISMADRIAIMDHGKVIQCGTPNEIYAHPKNAFVASFIGKANIVNATIQDHNLYVFATKLDSINLEDQNVQLAIRKEDIVIDENLQGMFEGVVQKVIFKGMYYEVEVNVHQQILHCYSFQKQNVQEGSKVGVTIKNYHLLEK